MNDLLLNGIETAACIDILNKGTDTALIAEILAVILIASFIRKGYGQTGVNKILLLQSSCKCVIIVVGCFLKYILVCLDTYQLPLSVIVFDDM